MTTETASIAEPAGTDYMQHAADLARERVAVGRIEQLTDPLAGARAVNAMRATEIAANDCASCTRPMCIEDQPAKVRRVPVAIAAYKECIVVLASDHTIWAEVVDFKTAESTWARLPDLPQEGQ